MSQIKKVAPNIKITFYTSCRYLKLRQHKVLIIMKLKKHLTYIQNMILKYLEYRGSYRKTTTKTKATLNVCC